MRKLGLIFLAILFTKTLSAQEKKNSLYLEAGGNTIYYSINYDRIIPLTPKLKLAPRAGFMYFPQSAFYDDSSFGDIRIPVELNLLWSKNPNASNFLEGGIGISFIQIKERVTYGTSTVETTTNAYGKVTLLRLGFRHQKPTGGLMYRAGLLVPIARDEYSQFRMGDDIFYVVWAGFSIGYSF